MIHFEISNILMFSARSLWYFVSMFINKQNEILQKLLFSTGYEFTVNVYTYFEKQLSNNGITIDSSSRTINTIRLRSTMIIQIIHLKQTDSQGKTSSPNQSNAIAHLKAKCTEDGYFARKKMCVLVLCL